ncbi:MAG: hypothetical protein ACYDAQ_15720, partial [Mycobacteriales bacterium]
PDDARVVSADHGCGAHSEALVLPSAHPAPVSYDDSTVDLVPDHPAGSVAAMPAGSGDEGEPYGHS